VIAEQDAPVAALVIEPVHTLKPHVDVEAEFAAIAAQVFAQEDGAEDPSCVHELNSLATRLLREFGQAKIDRQSTEDRWLKDLRQYKGRYDPEVEAGLAGRSKSFVRKTRVKVKTVDSRVVDLLFPAGSEKNWTVDTTPVPSVDDETKQQIAAALTKKNGSPPTPDQLEEGILEHARECSKGMSKAIEDQLVEARYKDASVKAAHSGHLYGTGILKGPLVERKVRTKFVRKGGKWASETQYYTVPFVDYVPLWRFYPDMSATDLEQCRFVFERHLMTKAQLLDLAKRKSFKAKRQYIIDYVKSNPDGQWAQLHFDTELQALGERESTATKDRGQYEVLERWGWIDGEDLKSCGVKIPDDRVHETFFSNIWMLPNGEVIKAALQPINGVTWPYHLYYFDKDETSIFGEGLAAVMRDDQEMLNAAVRMMLDNGALTSGPMVEVFLGMLARTENADKIAPWKVYYRNDKDTSQSAVRPIKLDNNIEWLQQMAAMFEQNTDETTAIPRYMSGENATNGAAGTASGMSMLMGAANIVIKDLITAWDEGITRPFLQALYRWNMQFNPDGSIKGDFDVKARGTASLVAKEVRAQKLNEFSQLAANPMDAPFVKRHELLRARAEALELSDVVKTEDEVKAEQETEQAKKMAQMNERLAAAQLALAEGQAANIMAQAEKTRKQADEILANIEVKMAQAVKTQVDAIFAALQAGGVATSQPVIAPAGDEILKSAGFKDKTPTPSIAQLDGPPVQQQQGTVALTNKGQSFQADPRFPQGGPDGNPVPPSTNGATAPEPATPTPPSESAALQPDTASASAGANVGEDTTRFEQ
jgi:hypothetical protein